MARSCAAVGSFEPGEKGGGGHTPRVASASLHARARVRAALLLGAAVTAALLVAVVGEAAPRLLAPATVVPELQPNGRIFMSSFVQGSEQIRSRYADGSRVTPVIGGFFPE